jgi:hypothetical protein
LSTIATGTLDRRDIRLSLTENQILPDIISSPTNDEILRLAIRFKWITFWQIAGLERIASKIHGDGQKRKIVSLFHARVAGHRILFSTSAEKCLNNVAISKLIRTTGQVTDLVSWFESESPKYSRREISWAKGIGVGVCT